MGSEEKIGNTNNDTFKNPKTLKRYFGQFGGQFVPELLIKPLQELEIHYLKAKSSKEFKSLFNYYLKQYAGRPTPLYFAQRLTSYLGGAKIYLKREDLCHLGAHKINNSIGQALLAKQMGKKNIIAETGAGQHGVSVAAVSALFGLKCKIFMGAIDAERQKSNVFRMELMGAEVIRVHSGSRTLKDACSEALRYWAANFDNTYYLLGSAVGPHPYPTIVRDFQTVIGRETKRQILRAEGRLPDYIIACVGGGSNSIGIFYPFLRLNNKQGLNKFINNDFNEICDNAYNNACDNTYGSNYTCNNGNLANQQSISLIGVEAGGVDLSLEHDANHGAKHGAKHGATLCKGTKGVFQGSLSYVLQDEFGQVQEAHSISAGLDYPGVGPEHSYLKEKGLVQYCAVSDSQAVEAFKLLTKLEGIIPALESSHALAYAIKIAPKLKKEKIIVVNLSGRGDKDLEIVNQYKSM